MTRYTPRRCSKRWLDGDCPAGVLAILDDPDCIDRYTILFTEVSEYDGELWMHYLGTSPSMNYSGYGEMRAHHVAAYRDLCKGQYIRWTDLPENIREHVRNFLSVEV